MGKKLWSIFTNDMNTCIISGYHDPEDTYWPMIERHHVFGGYNRKRSELYGYIAPLHKELHPNGVCGDGKNNDLDLILKQACQLDYESHIGTREDFIQEFGRSYLDEGMTAAADYSAINFVADHIPQNLREFFLQAAAC